MIPKTDHHDKPFHYEMVIPCYNPSAGWENGLNSFLNSHGKKLSVRLIFVDDGSTLNLPESTVVELAQKHQLEVTFIRLAVNSGKGFALRTGVEQCRSNRIIYTDADFPFENHCIAQILESLDKGNDIVFGYRQQEYYHNLPYARKLISRSFRVVLKLFISLKEVDTQCGLKGFNSKGKKIFMAVKTNRYLFDFEFMRLACRNKGLKIASVKADIKKDVTFSSFPFKMLIKEFGSFLKIIFIRTKVNLNEQDNH